MNHRNHRATDPDTSAAGAQHSTTYRAGTQKAALLTQYRKVWPGGLTDEEAADLAGLNEGTTQGWWKRCADLRRDGAIVRMDGPAGTRDGHAGSPVMVCCAVMETPDGGTA